MLSQLIYSTSDARFHRFDLFFTSRCTLQKMQPNQLFFMNEKIFFAGICEEGNREPNKHLCATEGTFRWLRFQFFKLNVYRTGCIADSYWTTIFLIAEIEINWKISSALKTILLCMEFAMLTTVVEGIKNVQTFRSRQSVETQIYFILNLFVEMKNAMQTIN